jgi:RimJ/RimL family protein N-acetyltransferase
MPISWDGNRTPAPPTGDTRRRATAFEALAIDVIQAGSQPENEASLRVMQKLGMKPVGEKLIWSSTRNREEVCLYFEVPRDSWQTQGNK